MGNKPLGAPPQAKDFEAFSHYSEQRSKLFGTCYFYKPKNSERGFLIRPVEKTSLEGRLKPHHEIYLHLMNTPHGAILKYQGIEPKLPSFEKTFKSDQVLMRFDPYDYDLDYEITNRIVKKRFFTKLEIWSLIFVTVKGLSAIQEAGTSHGCICGKTILIDRLDFKMIYPDLLEVKKAVVFPYIELTKFSDEIRSGLEVEGSDLSIQQQSKVDVFFLGLLLLEACTLQSFSEMKNIGVGDINQALLNLKLEYSEDIFRVVREMLVLKLENRPDSIKLNKIIEARVDFSGSPGRTGKQ